MMNINATRATILAAALATFPIAGMALDVKPSITLGEIYTDNVDLTPSNLAQSEWVTRVAPRVTVGYEGSRLALDVDYTYELLLYANDSGRNSGYNELGSSALLDLISKDLQLRGQASVAQVNITPSKPVTNSNINTTGNRTDATIWSIGPQWNHRFFSNSEIDGHLWAGDVNYNAAGTQDIKTTNGLVSVHTADKTLNAINYEAAYEYDKLAYQITGDTVVASTWLQLGYQINESFEVFGLGGLDSDFSKVNDPSLTEPRWEVGAASTFGAESVRGSFGHRFFGSTYSFNWDHQQGDFTYGLSYSESPSTSDLTTLRQIPTTPPGTPPVNPPPDPGINQPGNPTQFIRDRADGNLTWKLYRSALSFNAFWEKRTDQFIPSSGAGGASTTLNDDTSYGTNVDFRWELGTRSDATIGGGWTHAEFSTCDLNAQGVCDTPLTNDKNDLYTLRAGLNYQLGSHTSLDFLTGYQSRTASASGTSDYDEYWASVQVVRTF